MTRSVGLAFQNLFGLACLFLVCSGKVGASLNRASSIPEKTQLAFKIRRTMDFYVTGESPWFEDTGYIALDPLTRISL